MELWVLLTPSIKEAKYEENMFVFKNSKQKNIFLFFWWLPLPSTQPFSRLIEHHYHHQYHEHHKTHNITTTYTRTKEATLDTTKMYKQEYVTRQIAQQHPTEVLPWIALNPLPPPPCIFGHIWGTYFPSLISSRQKLLRKFGNCQT